MSLDAPLNGAADWTEAGPLDPISVFEVERLGVLVATVRRHLDGFLEACTALAEIRGSRLYRDTHSTFEAFCAAEFGIGRAHAYRMIEAAEVVSPMGDTGAPLPTNERQARALAAAPPEDRADVMAAVARKGKPTAAAIADEVEARRPVPAPPPAPTPAEDPDEVCTGCGAVDKPGTADGMCVDCWEGTAPGHDDMTPVAAPPAPKPASRPPKPPRLGDLGTEDVDRCWKPAHALGKALRTMAPPQDVMRTLPPDSLESFDDLADEAIAWAESWKKARKASPGLRLVEGR